jgi:hypothetical protein
MAPGLDLAVLLVDDPRRAGQDAHAAAPGEALVFDETRVPNLVFRAVAAQPAAGTPGLETLVPGH